MFTSSNSTFPMNYNHRNPPPDPWALYVLAAVGALCFAVVLSMLTGCTTTRTVERITVHRDTLHVVSHDTLRELRTVRDSVFLHDSVYFEGATLVKERTRDRWHVCRDTVWRSRADSVRAASHHTDTRSEKKTTRSFAPHRHAQREEDDAQRFPLAAVVADRLPCCVRPDRLRAETAKIDGNAPLLVC